MAGRSALKLPAGVEKLPSGVEINGKHIRIHFTYNGQRFREPLPGVSKINKATITYAGNKRQAIITEIKEGRFNYEAHFPDSPRVAEFAGVDTEKSKRTVKQGIDRWLEVQRAKKASSTVINYQCKARHVEKRFGKYRIDSVTKSDLELFQAKLLKQGLAPKTVNDIFTVVRGVWS